jgi:hypothetical protein
LVRLSALVRHTPTAEKDFTPYDAAARARLSNKSESNSGRLSMPHAFSLDIGHCSLDIELSVTMLLTEQILADIEDVVGQTDTHQWC